MTLYLSYDPRATSPDSPSDSKNTPPLHARTTPRPREPVPNIRPATTSSSGKDSPPLHARITPRPHEPAPNTRPATTSSCGKDSPPLSARGPSLTPVPFKPPFRDLHHSLTPRNSPLPTPTGTSHPLNLRSPVEKPPSVLTTQTPNANTAEEM